MLGLVLGLDFFVSCCPYVGLLALPDPSSFPPIVDHTIHSSGASLPCFFSRHRLEECFPTVIPLTRILSCDSFFFPPLFCFFLPFLVSPRLSSTLISSSLYFFFLAIAGPLFCTSPLRVPTTASNSPVWQPFPKDHPGLESPAYFLPSETFFISSILDHPPPITLLFLTPYKRQLLIHVLVALY